MKFSDIPEVQALVPQGSPNLTFNGIQCDSRRVRPGDLFAAINGTHESGGKYAATALSKGAVAVLSETPLSEVHRQVVQVTDVRRALACLSAATHGWPSRNMRVFGITGTNGKTTTAWLLWEMLAAAGMLPGLLTTVKVMYGDREIPATRTTPDACELQSLLASMREVGCDSAVMEVSSHALDQQRTAHVRFAGVAFTNLSRDHLDYHGTMEAYFDAKRKLFEQAARETPGTPAVCCLDGEYGAQMATVIETLPLRRMTYGFSPKADLRAEEVCLTPGDSRFTLITPDGRRQSVRVQLAGRYNVANMLCATGLALMAEVPLEAIVNALEAAKPRWGRLEQVPLNVPFTVFVDYAHTDDALTNVLGTLREMTREKLIVVFGCGGERDCTKRPLMGRACATLADYLVITSDNPRGEDPQAIIDAILEGVPAETAYTVMPDRRLAIRQALTQAGAGDVVLIAGKGHESFQEQAGRTLPFDDRLVVQEEALQMGIKGQV